MQRRLKKRGEVSFKRCQGSHAQGAAPRVWMPTTPQTSFWPQARQRGGSAMGDGWGGWHKALVVGSVSLWRRLLASRL